MPIQKNDNRATTSAAAKKETMMTGAMDDAESLAAAVDVVLELLDVAERRPSFPGPGREPDPSCDDNNERYKLEAIKRERRRYKELRARLVVEETHGVPVSREFLDDALGLWPTELPGDECEELYLQWLAEKRGDAGADL